MKNKQENMAKPPEKLQFFRETSLRYQSVAAWELYTMFPRLMGPTFEKIIILLLGRRMSIQKMQFRCTPRGTT
jgi:hypothetical protein